MRYVTRNGALRLRPLMIVVKLVKQTLSIWRKKNGNRVFTFMLFYIII